MIAIVTALREELSPLLRRAKIDRVVRVSGRRAYAGTLMGAAVVLMVTGDGLVRAEEAVAALLQTFDVSLLIGAGIAGAIVKGLKRGDLVVASEVIGPDGTSIECAPLDAQLERVIIRSVERIVGSVAIKHRLAERKPAAQVIDTESAGWGLAARKFGVKFIVIRAIFDGIEDEIPEFIAAGDRIDRGAVARHALLHPKTIPGLLQMRRRLRTTSEALADTIVRAIPALDAPSISASDAARLHELLTETSRTFALCIPLLPAATRLHVTIAYLLFRVADTFEDASHWPAADRIRALDEFCALLRLGPPTPAATQLLATAWTEQKPANHPGYMRLIADVPLVMDAFRQLPPAVNEVIREHVIRSAQGMAKFVAMTRNGTLQLADMQQLRDYCYAVAGIVGEMLTELFLQRAPQLHDIAPFLRDRSAEFGEGLQLVNILKDSRSDATEGRTYIPPVAARADIAALARTDLESATEYTLAMQNAGAPDGIVEFAALPVALAHATLDRLESSATATKIGRTEVFGIARQVNQSIARGEPALRSHAAGAAGRGRMWSMLSLLFGNGNRRTT